MAASGQAISLDHLIAVNDELAGLVRAGVPLEKSLVGVGGEIPGKLGRLLQDLGGRLERGESLAKVVADDPRFPPVYKAMVEAGMRTGRLAAALESLTASARHLTELRRCLAAALVYPMLVLIVAYGLLVTFLLYLLPILLATFASFQLPTFGALALVERLGETVMVWGPAVPCVLFLLVLRSSVLMRGRSLDAGLSNPLTWLPQTRRLLVGSRLAAFTEILGLLLEHQVGLSDSLRLAAEATGDGRLIESCRRLAVAIDGGGDLAGALKNERALPPFLAWTLTTGAGHNLDVILRQSAENYRERVAWQADMLKLLMPTAVLIAIGGTATALFALTVFVPFVNLLVELADG